MRRRLLGGVAGMVAVCGASACADLLLPSNPGSDAADVAMATWKAVDEYYPYFDLKGINWDSVGQVYLPLADEARNDRQLVGLLAGMLYGLRDGHVVLESSLGRTSYEAWHAEYPDNYDENVTRRYLGLPAGNGAGGAVWWGTVADGIGYIHIATFAADGIGAAVDQALDGLGEVRGIIVDVRGNGGGSDTESEAAAGRFTSEARVYRRIRYKTGPGHEDFGPLQENFIRPAGAQRFTGPVAVLQNRGVYSAAEDFILAMRVRDDVTFVGDTTGGGTGNPIGRELPNGWVVFVPRWRLWAADGTQFEGVGLAPDQWVPSVAQGANRDAILERAIGVLRTP